MKEYKNPDEELNITLTRRELVLFTLLLDNPSLYKEYLQKAIAEDIEEGCAYVNFKDELLKINRSNLWSKVGNVLGYMFFEEHTFIKKKKVTLTLTDEQLEKIQDIING